MYVGVESGTQRFFPESARVMVNVFTFDRAGAASWLVEASEVLFALVEGAASSRAAGWCEGAPLVRAACAAEWPPLLLEDDPFAPCSTEWLLLRAAGADEPDERA
jgi:hypothetical protein